MKSSKRKFKRVRPIMGTYVEIELHGTAPEELMRQWITAGFEAIQEIDRLMSIHKPDSDLSRLNQGRLGEWLDIHPHTLKVLQASNKLFIESQGAFDIRCMTPFSSSSIDGPPTETFGSDGMSRVRKNGPWTYDLGGIAKGYAVDCAVETIKGLRKDYSISGIVNAGGDLRRWGRRWPAVAVATSAVRNRENVDRLSQATHVHMPSGKILRQEKAVSVLSERCLWSDALTKIMLLAPQKLVDDCLKRYDAYGLVLA